MYLLGDYNGVWTWLILSIVPGRWAPWERLARLHLSHSPAKRTPALSGSIIYDWESVNRSMGTNRCGERHDQSSDNTRKVNKTGVETEIYILTNRHTHIHMEKTHTHWPTYITHTINTRTDRHIKWKTRIYIHTENIHIHTHTDIIYFHQSASSQIFLDSTT